MTTTNTPDAEIFALIASCGEAGAEAARLDERSVRLLCAGKVEEAAEFERRSDIAYDHATRLESQILRETTAQTPAGHDAKFRFAIAVSLDAEDFVEIAYLLGYEAARLGLQQKPFEPDILVAAAAA